MTVEKPSLTRQEINERIKNRWEVEGMLEIPSIDLILPIIENATMRHLRVSAVSILETTKPWSEEIGNYVVTAHRSRRRGRHFNRLGEIAIGERIILTDTRGIVYEYEVYEIKIVHETDMSILLSQDFEEITLFTCDPIHIDNPDTRLVIKAKLIEKR